MTGPWTGGDSAVPDARLKPFLAEFPPELFDDHLYRSIAWAEAYVLALSLDVLAELGAPAVLAQPVAAAHLGRLLRLAPAFDRSLIWLLERAATAMVLAVTNGAGGRSYHLAGSWPTTDVDRLSADGLAIDEGNRPTVALLQAAAAAWPRVARGDASGEDALLNPESIGLWLDYFDNANLLYAANNRVAAFVAARRLAERERFSILELGAGAGSGSEALLQELNHRRLLDRLERFVVTEPSALLRRRGERRLKSQFPDRPLQFAALDVDRPWAGQRIDGESFELVYGVNVLHVAKDLAFSLREARARLSPGGSLVLGECLRPYPDRGVFIEFAFQLLESFSIVTTDPQRRPRPGFLTPEEWQRSLIDAGFAEVELRPDHYRTRDVFPHLFIAAVCGR